MTPRFALFASISLGLVLTAGCGGSTNSDLVNGGGSGGTGGSGASSSTGGASTGGNNTGGQTSSTGGASNGGTGNNTGGSAGNNTGGNAGSGGNNTGGNAGSGGNNTGGSAGNNTGGSGGNNTGGSGGNNTGAGVVNCGSSQCDVSKGGTCCASFQGLTCASGSQCPNQPAAPIKCDGPEDCPGQVCCGTIVQYGPNSYYSQIRCQNSCGQQNERVMCGNHPNACPNNQQCVNSQLLPGFRACSGN